MSAETKLETEIESKSYKVQFDFTTVNNRNLFTGRHGECEIQTKQLLHEIDWEDKELLSVCATAVLYLKPKWKIFMLKIKDIKPVV